MRRGIIPARAGFTTNFREAHHIGRDHPRSRGVYPEDLVIFASPEGSSPLARGLPHSSFLGRLFTRIIPARAGFTYRHAGPAPPLRDHPRSRGVYVRVTKAALGDAGSSPLARGLLCLDLAPLTGYRIIPARAGFTRRRTERSTRPGDHPRSRGVYKSSAENSKSAEGSSPLARGLPRFRSSVPAGPRIIPARAGFT